MADRNGETVNMNITLHMTDKCNLACDYCYVPKAPRSMNEKIVEQSIRFAMSDGNPTISLVFFGGALFAGIMTPIPALWAWNFNRSQEEK